MAYGLSLGENSDERNKRAQDHNRLKTDRSHDPFQEIGLELGQLSLESRLEPRLKVCQIRLCGKIPMRRFPQSFGERPGLLDAKMAFFPQGPGEAKGIEKKGVHRRNMERSEWKVHQRSSRHRLNTHAGFLLDWFAAHAMIMGA